jgi:TetR/AcrR family transcriptional repressor of nem operon
MGLELEGVAVRGRTYSNVPADAPGRSSGLDRGRGRFILRSSYEPPGAAWGPCPRGVREEIRVTARAEQKGRTRERILESAARLLRERGIAGAGVAEVMKGASLTVGGFYAHFASKEALVDEALGRTAVALRERLFARIEEKPAAARAEVLLKRYLSPAHRDDIERGCPLPAVVGEVGTTASAHGEALAEQIDAMASRIEALLPTPCALPRRHVALGLIALMVGGLSLSRALRGTPLSDEVLKASRALGTLATRGESA